MKPFELVSYKGKTIVVIDIADTLADEAIGAFKEAQKQIFQLPLKSALILTDVSNATYSRASAAALKEFASKNTPFVKASAVVGVGGAQGILLLTVQMFTKRTFKSCKTREEAMEWLAGHD